MEVTFWSRSEERGDAGGAGGEDAHGSRGGGVYWCDWFRGRRIRVLVTVTRTVVFCRAVLRSICFKAVVTRRVAVAAAEPGSPTAAHPAWVIPIEFSPFSGAFRMTNVAFDRTTSKHVVARTRAF